MLSSRPVIGLSSAASSSESAAGGFYKYKNRPLSGTQMRRQWLAGLIREVHTASRQTYGSRRVHAELTLGMGVRVSERLVAVLMSKAKIAGLPGSAKVTDTSHSIRPTLSACDSNSVRILSRTPSPMKRRCRFHTVCHGPKFSGESRHGIPAQNR